MFNLDFLLRPNAKTQIMCIHILHNKPFNVKIKQAATQKVDIYKKKHLKIVKILDQRVYDLTVAKKDERLKLFKPPRSHHNCPTSCFLPLAAS